MYIYGGKLTTYRRIGEEAVDLIADALAVPRNCCTGEHKLLGGDRALSMTGVAVSPDARQRLVQRYGSGVMKIESLIAEDGSLADRLTDTLPFLKAEAIYACWGEMAPMRT